MVSMAGSKEEDLKQKLSMPNRQKFDVFLSYAEEDEEFAEEVRTRLVRDLNLRIFIPSEGRHSGSCSAHAQCS